MAISKALIASILISLLVLQLSEADQLVNNNGTQGTPSAKIATSGIKHGRGSTREIALLRLYWRKLIVYIPDGLRARRSAINRENRAKLKIVHTSGALKISEFDQINLALLYKKMHTNKDDMLTLEDAQENFEKMEVLQLQYESKGKPYTEVKIFARVLRTKVDYVRDLGCSIQSIRSSSSVSSVDLSRRLEETRLKIEEMKAR
ncbi:hypothetical protein CJ030_MR8G002772 [Morella rubra]|uniref:Uncharacterized protein n=1 Tax=Morella rubra TaxID=262757 RepID=A0A6A1UTI8_9ROSI|nr:hypothetical protein CJ030_MR8G002772 [Morella rubra]